MRKGLVVLLVAVVVAMFTVPAMAGTDVTGFYRAKGYVSNFKDYGTTTGGRGAIGKDVPANAYVEQRLRMKFTSGDENVKAVAFFEIDSMWGDANYVSGRRNAGAALGADTINLETKNVFVWFKLPDTSLDFTVGLQNQSDSYAGVFFGAADMAGIFANAKVDPVALRFGWSKWFEGATNRADDVTLYLAEAKLVPTKDMKLGLNLYYLTDDTNRGVSTNHIWMPGVDFSMNAGPAAISAFAFYQNGKQDFAAPAVTDIKRSGFAVDARADLNAGPGKAFLEGIYISGGDGSDPTKVKSIITANSFASGQSFFARPDLQLLLPNGDDINTSQGLLGNATRDLNNGERGMYLIAAGYTQKLTDKLTGKVGAGYMASNKLTAADKLANRNKGMGTEINANVNYNITKGLDVGLYAAYAFLGDFFKGVGAPATEKPDNAYDTHFRVNYAF